MPIQQAHRHFVSKARRVWRSILGTGRLLFHFSRFNTRHRSQRSVWIALGRAFLILVVILLLVCTAFDVLRQSFESGQFWNAIIVIVCCVVIILWTCAISLVRRVDVARWMRAIPRERQIGKQDITPQMMQKIEEKRLRCKQLFRNQIDFSAVEHNGLKNPLHDEGMGGSDVPFWELADTIPRLLESNVTLAIPKLTIPVGCTLREYLLIAIQEKALELKDNDGPVLERFIELYERLRYSSHSMSWDLLTEMMDSLIKVGYMILDSRGYSRPGMQWHGHHLPQPLAQHLQVRGNELHPISTNNSEYSHFSVESGSTIGSMGTIETHNSNE